MKRLLFAATCSAVVTGALLSTVSEGSERPTARPREGEIAETPAQRVARLSRRSVVVVECTPDKGKPVFGSGFYLSSTGLLATNAHVIEACADIFVRDDRQAAGSQARLVFVNAEQDVAVLKAAGIGKPALRLAPIDSLSQGQQVFAIGHPAGLEFTVSDGIISAFRSIEERRLLQTTAPISPGSSGGPLLDAAGRVVGMTTSFLKGGQNLNFAVPVDVIKESLARAEKAPETEGTWPIMTSETAASFARTLAERNNLSRAEEVARTGLRGDPNHLGLLLALAEVLYARDQPAESERIIGRILDLDPDNASAHALLGALLSLKGSFPRACEESNRALELGVDSDYAGEVHSVLYMCEMLRAKDSPSEQRVHWMLALAHIEKALASPKWAAKATIHVIHAKLLLLFGRMGEASAAARAALALPDISDKDRATLKKLDLPRTGVRVVSIGSPKERPGIISGIVVNEGEEPEVSTRVSVECRDGSGRVVGIGTASVEPARLPPGGSGSFESRIKGPMQSASECNAWVTTPEQ